MWSATIFSLSLSATQNRTNIFLGLDRKKKRVKQEKILVRLMAYSCMSCRWWTAIVAFSCAHCISAPLWDSGRHGDRPAKNRTPLAHTTLRTCLNILVHRQSVSLFFSLSANIKELRQIAFKFSSPTKADDWSSGTHVTMSCHVIRLTNRQHFVGIR